MLLPGDPILHVGDRLRIVCSEAPELCVERTIGPDGTIDLPLIGPMIAALRKTGELAKRIEEGLPLEDAAPRVDIRWLGSAKGELSIEGAVKRPLRVYAPRGIDAERLFASAELLPEADRTLVGVSGRVLSGTNVIVPLVAAERRINVLGAVAKPIGLPPAQKLLLSSALDAAGGLTTHADPNGIVVVRSGEAMPVSLPADANFPLQPGDIVRVGLAQERKFVVVRGLVARPGSIEYTSGMTVKAILTAAGGALPEAAKGTVVWQTGAKSYRLSLPFLLEGRIPNPVVGANDTLIVEATRS